MPPTEAVYSRISVPLITAIIVALCWLLYWQTDELRGRQRWIEHSYEVKLEVEELDRSFRELEGVQRAIWLTGKTGNGLQDRASQLHVKLEEHELKLRQLVADNAAQGLLVEELSRLLDIRMSIMSRNADELAGLDEQDRTDRIMSGVLAANAVEGQLEKIRVSEQRLLDERAKGVADGNKRVLTLAFGGSLLAVFVMLLTVYRDRKNRQVRDRYLARLAEARDTALDAVQATSTFVATVSHEIRTPMNGVLGAADLLRQDTRLDRRQRELVETIHYSGEALLDLVNDILDLSKLQAGKMDFATEEFSLSHVLEESMALFADAAGRKQLELAHRIAPEVPHKLKGDPMRLRQVLLNLVGNAVKFTERGSVVVDVSCRGGDDNRLVLRFRVSDTGPGIPAEEQGRLFVPFGQVNAAINRRHSGTGLGLAISMEIVQRLGGTIGVESKPGTGATFWFTARFEDAGVMEKGAERLCGGGTLLLLEGRDLTAGTIEQHVLGWGMKVRIVADLKSLETLPEIPDLAVVLIGRVTDASWRELMARISTRRDARDIPRFLLSAPHEAPEEHEIAANGVQACLRFPFRPSDLYNLLADERPEPAAHKQQEGALPHARILLVEDNQINQRVFSRQLEMLGMDMIVRDDGQKGVDARIAGDIDLILMDCQLPTMDGFEATRRIRSWEAKTGALRVPIIAVTAHVMSGDAEACFQAGMDDYLPKPFDLVKLRRKLGQWLQRANETASEGPAWVKPAPPRTLDSQQLGECLTGNEELDHDLIGAALEETGRRHDEMTKAFHEANDRLWKAAAHQGVGTAATMGFAELAEHFRKAEMEKDGNQRELLLERLGALIEKTRQSLIVLGLLEGENPALLDR
ncbi:ATP-binding protein [Luteolibacter yonseiensis]|uniref:ATP-binding protein n=1 Tax=Luteolibacter yonseiensis TaxID=1144680 RepID=UPI0031EF3A92